MPPVAMQSLATLRAYPARHIRQIVILVRQTLSGRMDRFETTGSHLVGRTSLAVDENIPVQKAPSTHITDRPPFDRTQMQPRLESF